MRETKKGLLTIVIVVLCAALLFVVGSNYAAIRPREEKVQPEEPVLEAPVEITPEPTPVTEPEPEHDDTPAPSGETVHLNLALTGDMVIHDGLNAEAKTDEGYDYTPIFEGAAPCIADADIAVSMLETTFAGTSEYSGYPLFKSPDDLAAGLKTLGFDLINTAGNHAMDSTETGLFRTLDVLDANDLKHVGTYRSQEERDADNGMVFLEANGIRLAFLAYSCGTDGIPVTDFPFAVNLYYKDYMSSMTEIDYALLDADMAAARESGADMIVVLLHWDTKYQTGYDNRQKALADYLFTQGADIILGGNTHVPQPMELRWVTDLNGKDKIGLICYSLGNLVSCQADLNTNVTAVVNVELEKDLGSGETIIKSVDYVPLYMMNLKDYGVKDAPFQYRLLDIREAMAAYENGKSEYITDSMYRSLEDGLNSLRDILGEGFAAAEAQ